MSSLASALKLDNVVYDKKGPIAYVTLSRPKVMNALNKATINELRAAFEDARDDSDVRGVILTGAGEKAFAAGADIAEIANNTAIEAEQATRRGQALTDLIENLASRLSPQSTALPWVVGANWRWRALSESLPRARNSASRK
ncbi:MAG TPA: enoyl-CoA hydratase-related protein [Candidatus Sulfotelmatobacter sp.]